MKYLKPYLLMILLAIGMLYGQVMADLALPDYMSDIINVGIQQGGIVNAVPEAIRQNEMDKVTIFLNADERAAVSNDYTLVDQNSPDYKDFLKEYPILATEAIYVLNTTNEVEIEKINPMMAKGLMIVSTIDQAINDPEKAAEVSQKMGFDLSKFPQGMDVFSMLSSMPETQRSAVINSIDEKLSAMGSSMIVQSAIGSVKDEYKALGVDVAKLQTNYLLKIGGYMLLLTLATVACSITVGYIASKVAAGVARDLRRDTFKKVESFSKTEFDRFSTASLITRTTNDITQIQSAVMMIVRMVFYAPIMGIGAILHAIDKSPSLSWIIALGVLVLICLVVTVFSIVMPKFKIVQSLVDKLNLVTRENLSGMMVVRAFNNQNFEEGRFDKANQDLTKNNLFVNRVMVVMMPIMTLLMSGLSLLIIWVGSHAVAEATMQVGDMMAFLQYATQVVMSFLMLSMLFIILPRSTVSANRIADVLAVEPVVKDPKEPKPFGKNARWSVEFRNVSFRYPDAEEDVLHDISFTALPGQTTAIIGSTGSGKSTVVNLIPRFYDVTGGAIYVDGVDIRDVKQIDLRDKIGYVPQKGMLFSGTVESNLRYADENASEEIIRNAAAVAQATEFISAMPEKMQSEIAQGGMNVSGGQRQRLAIARALVKAPPIYIFDDSFSAVDYKTDTALRKALKKSTGGSTVLIVAQRISTIKNAEQIVVLDDGKVVGKGTHEQLMKNCKTYQEIALSQLNKEELA
jgi:ATP-binding cassette subfamily B multidrug efflux pump